MELYVIPSNPSSLAMAYKIIRCYLYESVQTTHLPVDAKSITRQSAAAHWTAIDPRADFPQPLKILREGECVGKHPVAPSHWLSFLQVGVARHDVVDLLLCSGDGGFQEVHEMVF